MSVRPLVGWLVGWSVGRSVGNAFVRRSTRRTYWPPWPRLGLNPYNQSCFTHGSFVSEEHHLDWILEGGLRPIKARDFGSDRKALPDETDLTSFLFQFTAKRCGERRTTVDKDRSTVDVVSTWKYGGIHYRKTDKLKRLIFGIKTNRRMFYCPWVLVAMETHFHVFTLKYQYFDNFF